MIVRWCEVDQTPEDMCGGMHTKVDVTSGLSAAERMPAVEGVAAFLGEQRVLPPVGTDEVVIWDKDSTLGNTKQRHHLLPKNRPAVFEEDPGRGWLEYALAGELDEPFPAAVQLYKMMLWMRLPGSYARRYHTHIVSGSDDGARDQTRAWLNSHSLWSDVLRLRTLADRQADNDVNLDHMKITYIRDLQAKGLKVVLVVEDWPPLAKSIEEATGVPVLVLNPMYELDATEGANQSDGVSTAAGGQAAEFEVKGSAADTLAITATEQHDDAAQAD